MVHKITLKQACHGLIHYKTAVGLSPHTISDYKTTFKKLFLFFEEETLLKDISRKEMVQFFAWLQEDYISNPDGIAPRKKKLLAPKTIRNIHTNRGSCAPLPAATATFWTTWGKRCSPISPNIFKTFCYRHL